MYVPEMDGDFRIARFLEFYNEAGFSLAYDLPDFYCDRKFRVGDPAPIPFWISGKCHVIEGDAEAQQPERLFGLGARTHDVLVDLTRLLDDARSGRIKARIDEWNAEKLVSAYGDVFLEPPARSRYWVSKYRTALKAARKLAEPPHPIDVRLRNVSVEWLTKFAAKADLSLIGGMLGSASQGIYSIDQIRGIMFAFVAHKIATDSRKDLETIQKDDTISALFPRGIYGHFLQSGWPHVPFKYSQPDFDLLMKARISDGDDGQSFASALRLASILYGSADAPGDVADHALIYIRKYIEIMKDCEDNMGDWNYLREEWRRLAEIRVRAFDMFSQLNRICFGKDRVAGELLEGRFGISVSAIDQLRRLL